jgi:hypothetical protein
VFWPFLKFIQAGAYAEAGQREPGLALIDEAIEMGGAGNPIAPLFHIVRGDLELLRSDGVGAARESYEAAYAAADQIRARSPQLRAAVRLSRIATPSEISGRLATVRTLDGMFDEGRGAPDRNEAGSLLSGSAPTP